MIAALTATRLLDAWEATLGQPHAAGSLALLAACRGYDAHEVARWSVTARDRALFDLRIELFGASAGAVVDCPQCAERLDVELDLAALRPVDVSLAPVACGELAGTVDGYNVVAHRPSTDDVLAACATAGEAAAPTALLRRCLTSVSDPGGVELDPATIDAELEAALQAWMSEQLDGADVVLAMVCSACGQAVEAPFDIATFLLADVEAWAGQLLGEVHELATAYGWTESDVLALSARRRSRYLELIRGGDEPWPTH